MIRRLGAAFALLALLAGTAALLGSEAWADSITRDEPHYLWSGTCLVQDGVDRDPSQPVLYRGLSGLAIKAAGVVTGSCDSQQGFYEMSPDALRALTLAARVPNMAFALVLVLVVFLWARAWFGLAAGLGAAMITALEPTMLAHGHLATGDLPLTLGLTGTLAAHWAWRNTLRRKWLVAAGLAFGLALMSKVIALEALPLLAAAAFLRSGKRWRDAALEALAEMAAIALIGWAIVIVLNLAVRPDLRAVGAYPAPLSWVVPPGWVDSIAYQLQQAGGGRLNYLNGQVSRAGFPLYYVEAFALKTTVGLLILAVAAAVLHARRRARLELLYLWVPVALVLVVPSLSRLDLGVRYVMPAYPLLAVAAGSVLCAAISAAHRGVAQRALPPLAAAPLLIAVLSSLSAGLQHVGYFNEIARDRPERFLSNSNVDWGQDAWRLRDWWVAAGRPEFAGVYFGGIPLRNFGVTSTELTLDEAPPPGHLAISLNALAEQKDTEAGFYRRLLQCPDTRQRIGTSIQLAQSVGGAVPTCP